MRGLSLFTLFLLALMLMPTESFGEEDVDHLLSYQGRLTDLSGDPVPNASYSMVFSIYDDPVSGMLLWTEIHSSVTTEDGGFNVLLGSITPLPVDSLTRGGPYDPIPLYLEIQLGGDPPISPRTRLGGVLYAAVSQRLEGDVSTEAGVLIMTDPGAGDTTIASNASSGRSIWRDYVSDKQVTIQGSSIGITHISGPATADNSGYASRMPQGDAVQLKSDDDRPRLVVTTAVGGSAEIDVMGATFKMGTTDSASYSHDKAELEDAEGNKLSLAPAGITAQDGSTSGYIGGWSASRWYHYNPFTGDSVVFDLDGPARTGWYCSGDFFENDCDGFESCHDDDPVTSCIHWSGAMRILSVSAADVDNESTVEISPTVLNFVHSDISSTDTLLSFGTEPTTGGWWRVRSSDPGGTWSEWREPRQIIANSSTGDSLALADNYARWFSATNTAEVTSSSIQLTDSNENGTLLLTRDSIGLVYDDGVDSCGIHASLTDFSPKLFMSGRGGYRVFVGTSGTDPVISISNHGEDVASDPELTYEYDSLNRLISTIRADVGQDGDSTVTSATGMKIFDGDLTLTHDNTGIEFYDGASGLQTLVASGGGDIVATGSITASSFTGNGSALSDLSADSLASGTVATARGGTGLNTSATVSGSMLYTSGVGTWSTLPPGNLDDILAIGPSGEPVWIAPGLSDVRLKKNVSTIDNALDRVLSLRGVTYEWKKNDSTSIHVPERRQVGVIAQEVEPVFPELVSGEGDEYRRVDYGKLTAVLIEAVKELRAENNQLRERVEALERTTSASSQTKR